MKTFVLASILALSALSAEAAELKTQALCKFHSEHMGFVLETERSVEFSATRESNEIVGAIAGTTVTLALQTGSTTEQDSVTLSFENAGFKTATTSSLSDGKGFVAYSFENIYGTKVTSRCDFAHAIQ